MTGFSMRPTCSDGFGECEVTVRMTLTCTLELSGRDEPFHAVLPDRLEQMVSRLAHSCVQDHERLVHEGRDAVEHVVGFECRIRRNLE